MFCLRTIIRIKENCKVLNCILDELVFFGARGSISGIINRYQTPTASVGEGFDNEYFVLSSDK